jgi:hypothetical protein
MPLDTADAYREAQASMTALVCDATREQLERTVPATPLWSVMDVVRHVVGVARNIVDGTLPGGFDPAEMWQTPEGKRAGDAFTAAHLEARRGRSLDALLEEWTSVAEDLEPILRGQRSAPNPIMFIEVIPVSDLAVHLQDVRGALGVPGDRESAASRIAFASYVGGLSLRLMARGLPALRIRYDAKERVAGGGDVAATWHGDRFEIFRALSGRRSRQQILAMSWEGDSASFLPWIPAYGEREEALVE